MSEGRFRSALNGFNRQDVAAYIEGLAGRLKAAQQERDQLSEKCAGLEAQLGDLQREDADRQETVLQLQRQIQESDAALQQAAEELSGAQGRLAEAEAEAADLRVKLQALEAVSEEKAAAAAQLAELTGENSRLSAELEACRAQLAETAAQAEEYKTVKERVVGLELQASRRAVEIEHEAVQKAERIQRQAENQAAVLRQERETLGRQFRSDLRRLSQDTRFSSELLDKQLGQLSASLRDLVSSMESSAEGFGLGPDADPEAAEGCASDPAEEMDAVELLAEAAAAQETE